MIPSLEGWPTKAKEAPSPHEVRLTLLDINPLFQCLGGNLPVAEIKLKFQVSASGERLFFVKCFTK